MIQKKRKARTTSRPSSGLLANRGFGEKPHFSSEWMLGIGWMLLGYLMGLLWISSPGIATAEETYQIQPGDLLQIVVMGRPDYSVHVEVRPDGRFAYFGGEIRAAGRNVAQIAEEIQDQLQTYVTRPRVAVLPTPVRDQFFVLGEVNRPGVYQQPAGHVIKLPQVLAMAGGVKHESADLSNVILLEAGSESQMTYNLDEVESRSVPVHAGDVVWVGVLAQIRVSGQVQAPGTYPIKNEILIAHALALAGGALHDLADTQHLILFRADGTTQQVALDAQKTLGDGDILYVPHAYRETKLFVLGYVHAPGAYEVKGPVPVFEALAMAGGAIENSADLEKTVVIRASGKAQQIDLSRLYQEDAGSSQPLLLEPGDAIRIPRKRQINWSLVLSLLSIISVTVNLLRR